MLMNYDQWLQSEPKIMVAPLTLGSLIADLVSSEV